VGHERFRVDGRGQKRFEPRNRSEHRSDSETTEVKVYPKPVILVHGLWSNGAAWGDYHNYLEEAHSFAWKAYAVGADPKVAMMSTGKSAGNWEPTFSIRQNAQELGKQILHTQKTENAWRVDVVAHSMGGLISRYYIHHSMTNTPDGKPTIKHLVMLGTPNMGSPCADICIRNTKLSVLKSKPCASFSRRSSPNLTMK
jgi:triacylglycerol esterase/lipase EstA (alpha/beta hydrolase family)